jgi:hypothetical protein
MRTSAALARTTRRGGQAEQRARRPTPRYILGTLLVFAALNAFAGGWYGLAGAKGVPKEWLHGSPFRDYFGPSLILVVLVGGSFFLAAVAVFGRWRHARMFAIAAAAIVLAWLAVEVAIISYVSWMQPATMIGGLLILVLAWRLPRAQSGDRLG